MPTISLGEEGDLLSLIDLRTRPKLKFQVPNPPLFKFGQSTISQSKISSKESTAVKSKANKAEIELNSLRQKKAWELALAPAKQVPMQAFMMWMSGSGVQIFSVMMVYMLIKGAITASISVNKAFQPFESTGSSARSSADRSNPPNRLIYQKLTFIGCQSCLLLLGLWKVNGMGLLPTRLSDWVMYERRPPWALRDSMDTSTVFIP